MSEPSTGRSRSLAVPSSSSSSSSRIPDHHIHHHHHPHHTQSASHTSDHLQQQSQPPALPTTSAVASSSSYTLDKDHQSARSARLSNQRASSSPSASRRRTSASSPPSSPASASGIDDSDIESQSLSLSAHLQPGRHLSSSAGRAGSAHSDHPNTSAMATLTVNTPPATHQPDPMLQLRSTNSPLHKSSASFHQNQHQHRHSASPPPPSAPYTQPPVASSLANVTSGDGWAIVPKSERSCTASSDAAASASAPAFASPSSATTPTAQQPNIADLTGLSQSAFAQAANDASNRRCGPADLASSYDVPFGERASPAIISLAQRNARPLSRNATRPPSPLALSPSLPSDAPNPSGAHRGGLRGSDEDLEVKDNNVAMDTADDSCTSTGATPLVPPATRKLCVRHQRMADEGTTARLQR